MRILDWYIARILASTTFLTLAVFISVSGIIKFVEQMKAVGRGAYEMSHAALFVLYSIPRDVEIFFPMSALVGGLIGLGMMASNSELVVMQAAGLSRFNIIKSVMKTASVLILLSMAVGEWLAPPGEAAARAIRAQAISGGSLISSSSGIWAKDGDNFVNIGEVETQGKLKHVQIYRFNEKLELASYTNAKSAVYVDKNWTLQEVENTFEITAEKIARNQQQTQAWPSTLTPDKLGVVTVKPESLSISGLVDYLDYLELNQQDQSSYLLAFWRKDHAADYCGSDATACTLIYFWTATINVDGCSNHDGRCDRVRFPFTKSGPGFYGVGLSNTTDNWRITAEFNGDSHFNILYQ